MSNHPDPATKTNLEQAISRQLAKDQLPEFSHYLLAKITSRIEYERQIQNLRPRLWGFLGGTIFSLGLLAFAVSSCVRALAGSGSLHFVALSFSDFSVMLANWQDYAYSVLESLPLGAIALALGAGVLAVLAADFSARQWADFKKISTSYRH